MGSSKKSKNYLQDLDVPPGRSQHLQGLPGGGKGRGHDPLQTGTKAHTTWPWLPMGLLCAQEEPRDALSQTFTLTWHPLQLAAPTKPMSSGLVQSPRGAGVVSHRRCCPALAQGCGEGEYRRGVLQEGVLPRGRTAVCSGKRHNGRKPRFRLPMEKTLQDPWGEQPDTINVRIS